MLNIFKTLAAAAPNSLTVDELSEPANADPLLVRRICCWLAATRLVAETSKDLFATNKATKGMADPGAEGGLSFFHVVHNRAIQVLPDVLRDSGFKNPNSSVWKTAANTDMEIWPWMKVNEPEVLKGFHLMMSLRRYGDWIAIEPNLFTREEITSSSRPVLVDVGGSVGHQTKRVKEAHPGFAGRLVCQDLPEVVAQIEPVEGFDFMPHDLFSRNQ